MWLWDALTEFRLFSKKKNKKRKRKMLISLWFLQDEDKEQARLAEEKRQAEEEEKRKMEQKLEELKNSELKMDNGKGKNETGMSAMSGAFMSMMEVRTNR